MRLNQKKINAHDFHIMYIPKNSNKIGDWVVTSKKHESMDGVFTNGTKVKIIDVDDMRGYAIEDEFGNKMYEIGWEI